MLFAENQEFSEEIKKLRGHGIMKVHTGLARSKTIIVQVKAKGYNAGEAHRIPEPEATLQDLLALLPVRLCGEKEVQNRKN